MLSFTKPWLVLGCSVLAVSATWFVPEIQAADAPKKEAAAEEDSDPTKSKGRLPAYFKDVVDTQQKDKIYALQAEAVAMIAPLQEQIKKLVAERDAAIEKVLTAEQQTKLKKIRDEATAKRKATGLGPAKKEEPAKKAE